MNSVTTTPIRRPVPFEPTESLEPVDVPATGPAGPETLPQGRHLVVEQNGEQRTLSLTRPITRIGRGFGATLQLEDQSVSRRHAIVMQRHDRVRLLDDRSSNGTFVNGRRVLDAVLEDGDVIALGRVVLVYRERDQVA
jgi:pSer/pThr/pTyr-binding forkhead associated (FHA) protein